MDERAAALVAPSARRHNAPASPRRSPMSARDPGSPRRTLLSWSSGKDAAWALHLLQQDPECELVGLFTSLDERTDRVSMHGVPRALVEAQAAAADLPLEVIALPSPCPNEVYEERMAAFVARAKARGVTHMAFGDLFLEDVRDYRVAKLAGAGLEAEFPLWGRPTAELAEEMLAAGVAATLVSVDTTQAPAALAGRTWDRALLAELPEAADPCGENGEFHTFATAGPAFAHPIAVRLVDRERDERFAFARIAPA